MFDITLAGERWHCFIIVWWEHKYRFPIIDTEVRTPCHFFGGEEDWVHTSLGLHWYFSRCEEMECLLIAPYMAFTDTSSGWWGYVALLPLGKGKGKRRFVAAWWGWKCRLSTWSTLTLLGRGTAYRPGRMTAPAPYSLLWHHHGGEGLRLFSLPKVEV